MFNVTKFFFIATEIPSRTKGRRKRRRTSVTLSSNVFNFQNVDCKMVLGFVYIINISDGKKWHDLMKKSIVSNVVLPNIIIPLL